MDQTDRPRFAQAELLHLSNICVELLVDAAVVARARSLALALLPAAHPPHRRTAPVPEHAG